MWYSWYTCDVCDGCAMRVCDINCLWCIYNAMFDVWKSRAHICEKTVKKKTTLTSAFILHSAKWPVPVCWKMALPSAKVKALGIYVISGSGWYKYFLKEIYTGERKGYLARIFSLYIVGIMVSIRHIVITALEVTHMPACSFRFCFFSMLIVNSPVCLHVLNLIW